MAAENRPRQKTRRKHSKGRKKHPPHWKTLVRSSSTTISVERLSLPRTHPPDHPGHPQNRQLTQETHLGLRLRLPPPPPPLPLPLAFVTPKELPIRQNDVPTFDGDRTKLNVWVNQVLLYLHPRVEGYRGVAVAATVFAALIGAAGQWVLNLDLAWASEMSGVGAMNHAIRLVKGQFAAKWS